MNVIRPALTRHKHMIGKNLKLLANFAPPAQVLAAHSNPSAIGPNFKLLANFAPLPQVRAARSNPSAMADILHRTTNTPIAPHSFVVRQLLAGRHSLDMLTDKRRTTPTTQTLNTIEKLGWRTLQRGNAQDPMVLWVPQAKCNSIEDQGRLHQAQLRMLRDVNYTACFGSITTSGLSPQQTADLNNMPQLTKEGLKRLFNKFCNTLYDDLTPIDKIMLAKLSPAALLVATQDDVPILPVTSDVDTFQKDFTTTINQAHLKDPYCFQVLLSYAPYEPRGTLTPVCMPTVQANVADPNLYTKGWHDMTRQQKLPGGEDMADFHLKEFQYRELLPPQHFVEPYLGVKTVMAGENKALGGIFGLPPHIHRSLQKYWDARQILNE